MGISNTLLSEAPFDIGAGLSFIVLSERGETTSVWKRGYFAVDQTLDRVGAGQQ